MKLERVEIADYRSIFADEYSTPLVMELADGSNTLVGTNNCGKSNVLRAIALALDPHAEYSPTIDNPGPRPFAHPTVTLHFRALEGRTEDREAIEAAAQYERLLIGRDGYSSEQHLVLRVAHEPTGETVIRRETLLVPGGHNPNQPEQADALAVAISKLREAVRFVLVSSGESIQSVLEGNFREILHSVVKERLAQEFESAEGSRAEYVAGIESSLLAPLRQRLEDDIGALFPEITGATLVPEVPTIETTLSEVSVGLQDLVDTPLNAKGTGVRGGVLVAMLSYLANNATSGMIFALEEPEAFLHPSAQEDLRDRLEAIAGRQDVTLLITTHSPYIVATSANGRIFRLAKDNAGRTRISERVDGDADHAPMVADLYRDKTFEELLKRSSSFPEGTQAVLLVEGDGDKFSLELAANVVGRPDLLDGLHIVPANGAIKIISAAVVARASTEKPVIVLVDNDESGRHAYTTLGGHTFGFKKNTNLLTYASVFPGQFGNFPVEAEDLFAVDLLESFIDTHGQDIVDGTKRRPDDRFHYDFGPAAKELLTEYLDANTRPEHVRLWIDLILKLRTIAGLDDLGLTTADLIDAAPTDLPSNASKPGEVLIVTGKLDHARYSQQQVLILDTAIGLSPDLTHVGFYVDGEIKTDFPSIRQRYPSILFDSAVSEQLRATGKERDADVAEVIDDSLRKHDDLAGTTRQLLLLADLDDDSSIALDVPISNTKQRNNRPLAWTIAPRTVRAESIVARPTTTDELDALERSYT